ncbi:NADP-dependent oxidoreductase [Umezawaea beigongshangensis]|uniref:NADP-dependent oxidoreductase n=1 Tax=Umezawaea beigongshangensis TaxID=2780383 RepID=UPI0018F12432|nr:NADP-dependent oxidoreductase [Umezawaea beigongshangensis]
MKAIIFEEFGGPDVLHEAEVDVPSPGPGQVRARVRTAGANPFDVKVRSGAMREVFPTPLPSTPGAEFAGVVEELGEGVTELAVGDEVFGWSDTGAYAEQVLATRVVRKPAELSWEEAAALPVAGETSQRALDLLAVTAGDVLLVHGAAGGVGTIGVQLAVARGATVIGTASEANHEHLRALGATPLLYGDGLVERVREIAPNGVDAVYDVAGRGALPDSIELRGGTSRIVTIADPAASELGVPFSSGGGTPEENVALLTELAGLAASGRLTIAVASTAPLADAAKVHEQVESGHARGKVVLLVG